MGRSMFDFYVWSLCLNIATMKQTTTSDNQKPREDDSFELGDIDDDTDEQFYVWLMFERSYHARSYHSIV